MTRKRKPMFRVGQVVRINVPFYKEKPRDVEQYQRIVKVQPWPGCGAHPFGYEFLNGDNCNERYIAPLNRKERGDGRRS
jgi:hypothetical protein